jgi:hypothetical protein
MPATVPVFSDAVPFHPGPWKKAPVFPGTSATESQISRLDKKFALWHFKCTSGFRTYLGGATRGVPNFFSKLPRFLFSMVGGVWAAENYRITDERPKEEP